MNWAREKAIGVSYLESIGVDVLRQPSILGLFTLKKVCCSPDKEVVPRLKDEGHWKQCIFYKIRKLDLRSKTEKKSLGFALNF